MNNPKMTYFPEQDVIHLAMTDEDEMASVELSPNIIEPCRSKATFDHPHPSPLPEGEGALCCFTSKPLGTAELNADGELIGVEILKASIFLRDFILESTQAKLMQISDRAS